MCILSFLGDGSYGIPSEHLVEVTTGAAFIQILKKYALLKPYNLFYLQFLLDIAASEGQQCQNLVQDIEDYGEKYKEQEILYFTQSTVEHLGILGRCLFFCQ